MTDHTTKNLLQFCYTCPDAPNCETEEKCRACWTENELQDEKLEANLTTEELLRQYAF
ncbi:hypothetical protein [Paenibacillus endoradicis]|uniref:hypothetical protein n=1 Tax=Paenibacillus endoradicis TaxID=2972487 RepID=UPI0021595070|nr:hypothetical protein [Paenibacillus endoradicis]MCR8659870.1 hypothetical protein [Paenibacillus endoradicis]